MPVVQQGSSIVFTTRPGDVPTTLNVVGESSSGLLTLQVGAPVITDHTLVNVTNRVTGNISGFNFVKQNRDEVIDADPVTINPDEINPSRVFVGNTQSSGSMTKEPSGGKIVEIRPTLRRFSEQKSFYIEMVDSTMEPQNIVLDNGLVINALKITPTPSNFVTNSAKKINRYNTMTRWVEEFWGDEMDNITLSGSTFSFFAYNRPDIPNVGLTQYYRSGTAAYDLLQRLIQFYKFNGCIYQDNKTYLSKPEDPKKPTLNGQINALRDRSTKKFLNDKDNARFLLNHPRTGMISERMYIRMSYDYVRLIGYFETFDITEEASRPYAMGYNMVFKAEKIEYYAGEKTNR